MGEGGSEVELQPEHHLARTDLCTGDLTEGRGPEARIRIAEHRMVENVLRLDSRFEPLAEFNAVPADAAARDTLQRDALQAYVQRLESLCREAPYNWFNFYDFWNDDAR